MAGGGFEVVNGRRLGEFAPDSPLEQRGFELLVPPACATFENAGCARCWSGPEAARDVGQAMAKDGEEARFAPTLRWREADSNHRFRVTRPRFQNRLKSPLPDSAPTEVRREREPTPRGRLASSAGPMVRIPVPSSRQSVSRPHPLSKVENPGFPRGCARLAWRPGRQRRAGCFDIAPTGGNISVGPYSSTAVPLMGLARMPRRSQRTRGSGLNVK